MHKNGWFYIIVLVWLFTADKKNIASKLTSAKREAFEEVGLKLKKNEFIKIVTRIHQVAHIKRNLRQ